MALQYPLLVTPHSEPPQETSASFNIASRADLKDLPVVATGVDEHLVVKETLFAAQ